MTQRRIESISGWISFGLWFAFVCMCVIVGAKAQNAPEHTIVTSPAATKTVRRAGKLVTRNVPAVTARNPSYDQFQTELGLLGWFAVIVLLGAVLATGWWNWRRRQRIRVEIRAEAYDGRRGRSRQRDSGALRI